MNFDVFDVHSAAPGYKYTNLCVFFSLTIDKEKGRNDDALIPLRIKELL